jgi:uncharacterized HhH-GPD family protein
MAKLHLAQEPEADALLVTDPLALLIGMLLDQQIPLERAFVAPYRLAQRIGVTTLDAAALAAHDPGVLVEVFAMPPALHRFPKAMAERTQKLARVIVDEYGGDAAAVWRDASSGAELLARVARLPGFGKQKAQIFVALLGKQLGMRPPGWRKAAGEFGVEGSFKSVADIVDEASLGRVREYKQQTKAAAKAGG